MSKSDLEPENPLAQKSLRKHRLNRHCEEHSDDVAIQNSCIPTYWIATIHRSLKAFTMIDRVGKSAIL